MNKTQTAKSEGADWWLFVFALIAIVFSLADVNIAFSLGTLLIPYALYAAVRRLRDSQQRKPLLRFIAYGSCIALFVAGPTGCTLNSYRTDAAMQPVVSKLEEFYSLHGVYPNSAEFLFKTAPECPGSISKMYYITYDSGQRFSLTCSTFVYNKHIYRSETKNWADGD